jgi:hypothetical protein
MKTKGHLLDYLLPRIRDLIFIAVFYLVIQIGSMLFSDGDPGRHITAGRYMIENHTIITEDIFSYTKYGQPLTPHEWLAQIAFGAADMIMGLNGVVLLTAVILASTFSLIYIDLLRYKQSLMLAGAMTFLVALATSLHWLARPHVFTLLFFTLWATRLKRISNSDKVPLWQFPVIMLFWANTHGAFITGFVTWGAYLCGWLLQNWFEDEKPPLSMIKKLLWIGGTSFLITLINPVGWRLWQTSVGYVTNRYLVDLTVEYASPDFHPPIAWAALLLIALTVWLLSRSGKKRTWSESLLLTGLLILGLYNVRNMPLFAIIVAPVIITHVQFPAFFSGFIHIEERLINIEKFGRGFFWPLLSVIITVVLLTSGIKLDPQRAGYHFRPDEFPVQAIDWLETHPQTGNMFNEFGWGGYIIYRIWPEKKVFMDGQLDFYGANITKQHEQVINAEAGWEDIIRSYDIEWMMVPTDTPISRILLIHPNWNIIYQDVTTIIARKQ